MKTLLTTLALVLPLSLYAQDVPYTAANELRGSGRLVDEAIPVKPIERVIINQFPALVTVNTGATNPSVQIGIDDNLLSLIQYVNANGTLTLSFKEPAGKWVNKATINITINAPGLTQLTSRSNSDVLVRGLQGAQFNLTNEANGSVTLLGAVDTFNLVSTANGTINADKLPVQQANVVTKANATVRINARSANAVNASHASVINQVYKVNE
ncbi:DUF2807 domain-containing protein [Fibrella sp. HMF5335]|uniref:DUF2807 domain-containing protein n=1 Tax=Fibrella rubiginis TaxID=2817060 RepID=A0A939GHB7_9BACT|nr:DUF2807 domain-containing protein [Fibrella rubiginis]MBO0937475.1 DUF2807 domain-containing protein [Fibrella rubiginis]